MTFEPPQGPLPELSTTRVGGGFSARLIAVAVAGTLIAVVCLSVVSRPSVPPALLPTAPAVVALPTPLPTAAPPRNRLEGNDGIFSWPVVAQIGLYRGHAAEGHDTEFARFEGPRDPALYNRCRWDVAPLAAPPRPGTNEADC